MDILIEKYLNASKKCIEELKNNRDIIKEIVDILIDAKGSNRCIFICGNGGSASTASHMANDLQKIAGLRAICLTDNIPLVTAWSNDEHYEKIFSRQLDILADKGDTLIMISGSGNSQNLVYAVMDAYLKDMNIIAFLGQDGGRIKNLWGNKIKIIHIESDMLHAEDWHLTLEHLIAKLLENYEE